MATTLGFGIGIQKGKTGLVANSRMHATHRLMVTTAAPAIIATFPAAKRKREKGKRTSKTILTLPVPCAHVSPLAVSFC